MSAAPSCGGSCSNICASVAGTSGIEGRLHIRSPTPPPTLSITLQFREGTSVTCDLLIGADGVKFAVPRAIYAELPNAALTEGKTDEAAKQRSHIPAVFSGSVIYRTLIRKDALSEEDANHPALNMKDMKCVVHGENRHLVVYSISGGCIINVAAVVHNVDGEGTIYEGPWTSTVEGGEWVRRFSSWEPNV